MNPYLKVEYPNPNTFFFVHIRINPFMHLLIFIFYYAKFCAITRIDASLVA